jgi:NADPH-dependent 2,4-dienoyl-CoA reductase/sulfur reductase-like enzyme
MTGHIVIVGGSLAGLHTAEALRARGYPGRLTVVDAQTEPRYDRPPLSKEYLSEVKNAGQVLLRTQEQLAALGAEWRMGVAAAALDAAGHELALGDGTRLAFSKLVIATGVTPAWPAALRASGVATLRSKQDADRLRAALAPGTRLAVIGAGFIGLEVAATFASAGASVHVIEAAQAPLAAHLGPEVGRALQRLHERRGVVFHLGTQAAEVSASGPPGRTVRAVLGDGTAVEADVLLVAVGSAPATGWLAGSGLAVRDGVECDARLRAAPDIFAVGDVARWPHPLVGRAVRIEHWTNAVEQAGYVARQLADPAWDGAPFATVPYFWSDQYGGRLQAHGFAQPGDDIEVVDGALGSERFAVHFRRGGRLTAVVGLSSPRQVLAGRRQLAAELAAQPAVA